MEAPPGSRVPLRSQRTEPVIWFTGLSGAGKTTLARGVEVALRAQHYAVALLDGDEMRQHVNATLGFTAEDRLQSAARVADLAGWLSATGTVVLCALISPDRAARQHARELVEAAGARFLEVYVATPLAICAARDVKGLYRQAQAGELRNFIGLEVPYEPPLAPEVIVGPEHDLPHAVEAVLHALALPSPTLP